MKKMQVYLFYDFPKNFDPGLGQNDVYSYGESCFHSNRDTLEEIYGKKELDRLERKVGPFFEGGMTLDYDLALNLNRGDIIEMDLLIPLSDDFKTINEIIDELELVLDKKNFSKGQLSLWFYGVWSDRAFDLVDFMNGVHTDRVNSFVI